MMKEKLVHFNQEAFDLDLSDLESVKNLLQNVYRHLEDADIQQITYDDIMKIVAGNGHIENLRSLYLRGRKLELSGIEINSNSVVFPDQKFKAISSLTTPVLNSRKPIRSFYLLENEIVIKDSTIKDLKIKHSIYGSEFVESIIKDVDVVTEQMNKILKRINPENNSPLSDPENWIRWDSETRSFQSDARFLAQKLSN